MPALILDTCCGCIELRTGCLIIGYLNLVVNIIFIILGIFGLAGAVALSNHPDVKEHEVGGLAIAIIAITLVVMILLLGFIVALLVGIHKNKPGHVKAYLIFTLICIIIYVLTFFTSFGGGYTAGDIVWKLVNIILSIYYLLVIRSYYYKMKNTAPSFNAA